MTQKLLIGGLALAIVAVIGFGLADAGRVTPETEMQPVALAANASLTSPVRPVMAWMATAHRWLRR